MVSEADQSRKLKYPKSVFFIIGNEFCERFSYYGMKTILVLYLSSSLKYDTDTSTILYHVFGMLCYFFPLFGAIIADSFLGKFKTILYLSILYAVGNVVISVSAIPVVTLPHRATSLIGLLLIAIGTGGIKPCVSAFGGDQFVLPEQALQLQRFFSVFYFSINAGSLISTFWTPNLRNDVKCFGETSCFSLAFGIPAILMITSVIIFVCGRNLYVMKQPDENIIVIVLKCVWHALRNKISKKNETPEKKHWLEYADDKFGRQQISDIRAVFNVLFLFIPMPLFWALFDQQGSRWTFQATNMDGRLPGYIIKPDQMQVVNPLMILAFIPIFELYVYPTLTSVGIKRPLQKLATGGFLAALAFLISAYLEFHVQKSYAVLPDNGYGQLRLFNTLNCDITLNPSVKNVTKINSLSSAELDVPIEGSEIYRTVFELDNSCPYKLFNYESELKIVEKKAVSYLITKSAETNLFVYQRNMSDDLIKDRDGSAKISIFYSSTVSEIINAEFYKSDNSSTNVILNTTIKSNTETDFMLIPPGKYNLVSNKLTILNDIIMNPGEIDMIMLFENASHVDGKIINLVPSNKVHMLWQLPQIIVLTAGEIMFSITGLEFSFTQAPHSMKSVLSAAWLLTVAFGNLIVVVITEIKFFKSQGYEFLLFAGLMVLDMLLFIVLSMKYKYVHFNHEPEHHTINARNGITLNQEQISRQTSLSILNN